MPICNDHMPITRNDVAGHAVDALDARKEDGRETPFTTDEFRANYARHKDGIIAGLKALCDDETPSR